MPSQPVQSLDSELRVWKSPRHFRRLGGASESLSLDLGVSRYSPGAFLAPVSPGCFPISVWRGGDWFALGQRLVRRGHTCRLRAELGIKSAVRCSALARPTNTAATDMASLHRVGARRVGASTPPPQAGRPGYWPGPGLATSRSASPACDPGAEVLLFRRLRH